MISVKYEEEIIDSKIKELKASNMNDAELILVQDGWETKDYDSLNLATKVEFLKAKIKEIQADFTGEQKIYQDYLDALSEWELRKTEIEGNTEAIDSLNYIKGKLQYLDTELNDELRILRESRITKSIEIFSKKAEIKSFMMK